LLVVVHGQHPPPLALALAKEEIDGRFLATVGPRGAHEVPHSTFCGLGLYVWVDHYGERATRETSTKCLDEWRDRAVQHTTRFVTWLHRFDNGERGEGARSRQRCDGVGIPVPEGDG
jgi:hypothetical protein